MTHAFDPERDLSIERHLAAPRAAVWRCWSEPALLMQWFTPAPVQTTDCALDLGPGGRFMTRMRLPDGTENVSEGCFYEVVPGERLVFGDALAAGWRPNRESFMTAIITLADHPGGGTRYGATVLHADAAARARHAEMGFEAGWGAAIDQLDRLAAGL